MFFNSITEPSDLHWLDVKESYFNSYRAHMPGFFKAPGGRMIEYEEMKPRNLYKKTPTTERQTENTLTRKHGNFSFAVMKITDIVNGDYKN